MAENAQDARNNTSDDAVDEHLERWMLAYDEALAAGEMPTATIDGNETRVSEELRPTAACLDLIERVRRHESKSFDSTIEPSVAAELTGAAELIGAVELSEAAQSPEQDFPISIGRFEIQRELGRGGFGIVFLARDPHLDRYVALKVPRPEVLITADLRKRFLREAQAAGTFNHANIVAVFESGTVGAVAYIVTSYCEGPTLAEWLRERAEPVPARSAARLIAALAGALQHAHDRGVLHRDLKPANVILDVGECRLPGDDLDDPLGGLIPKIADFGLAKVTGSDEGQTRSHAIVGTPSYMAPEQAAGHARQIGTATDIYGLGTILYEMLTGKPPFRKAADVATLQAVQIEDPVAPRRIKRDIPSDLNAICLKCLEKEPARRYASATALADDLHRFLVGHSVVARPVSATQRLTRWARRNRALAALSATAAMLMITLTIVASVGYVRVNSALHEVDRQKSFAEAALASEQQQRQRAEQMASEATHQGELAEANFRAARDAVDDYLTTVSENTLVEEPTLLPLRKELLQHARDYYRQLARQYGDNPEMRVDLAVSYIRLSMISHDLDDPDWMDSTAKAVELFETLLAEGVSLVDLPSVSAGMYNVRSSRLDNSDPQRASALFQRATLVWEELYRQQPEVAGIQSDLAALHFIQGIQFAFNNESEEALKHFHRSRSLREALITGFPDVAIYSYFLAETLTMIGIEYVNSQQPATAAPLLKQAARLFRESLKSNPGAARIQFNLVLAQQHYAQSLFELGQPLPAMMQYYQGLRILEELAQRYPTASDYQVSLAASYASLAHTLKRAGMDQAAVSAETKTDQQVAAILERPVESLGNGTAVSEIACFTLANHLQQRKEYDAAEVVLQRFLQSRRGRPNRRFVSRAMYQLAMVDRAQGDIAACETRLLEAINIRRGGSKPQDQTLGVWLYQYGNVARQLKQFESAQSAYEEALPILAATLGAEHQLVGRLQAQLQALNAQ